MYDPKTKSPPLPQSTEIKKIHVKSSFICNPPPPKLKSHRHLPSTKGCEIHCIVAQWCCKRNQVTMRRNGKLDNRLHVFSQTGQPLPSSSSKGKREKAQKGNLACVHPPAPPQRLKHPAEQPILRQCLQSPPLCGVHGCPAAPPTIPSLC